MLFWVFRGVRALGFQVLGVGSSGFGFRVFRVWVSGFEGLSLGYRIFSGSV